MKIALLPMLGLLLPPMAIAQTPPPAAPDVRKEIQIDIQNPIKPGSAVPVKGEPHHVLVLENDYVHVFNVTVPPMDVTMLHQHDLPYVYLTLGTTDLINAIAGKPEAHLKLEDGTTRYTPGGFAHLVRTDAGVLFHNITVELARPQGSARNLGDKAADRPLGSCAQSGVATKQKGRVVFEQVLPCVETDELRMDLVSVAAGKDFAQASPETAALLIAMTNANLDAWLGGQHDSFLHAGDVLWLPAGTARKVVDLLGIQSQFLLISFKDSGGAAK
jgi:quercetin dioxygenase-like cupin family protein